MKNLFVFCFCMFLSNFAFSQQVQGALKSIESTKKEGPKVLQQASKTKRMYCDCTCAEFKKSAAKFGKTISNCIYRESDNRSFADVGITAPNDDDLNKGKMDRNDFEKMKSAKIGFVNLAKEPSNVKIPKRKF